MSAADWIGIAVGILVILGTVWRFLRVAYRLIRIAETSLERLDSVEKELRPNGGSSLRDRVDQVHAVAVDNNDMHTRIEHRLDEQARLTADAARIAAKADDEIRHIGEKTDRRHQENLARLDALERNDEESRILREWTWTLLRDKHGIDLLPDDEAPPRGDDPQPLS